MSRKWVVRRQRKRRHQAADGVGQSLGEVEREERDADEGDDAEHPRGALRIEADEIEPGEDQRVEGVARPEHSLVVVVGEPEAGSQSLDVPEADRGIVQEDLRLGGGWRETRRRRRR